MSLLAQGARLGLACEAPGCTKRFWPLALENKTLRQLARENGWSCSDSGDYCCADHTPTEVR